MDDSVKHYQETGELPPEDHRIAKLTQFAQVLITDASELQKQISTAKTQCKRDFYGKKMKKVRNELTQVLSTMEILKLTTKGTGHAVKTVSEASPV